MKQLFTLLLFLFATLSISAQSLTINFEEIQIEQDSFWNGSDLSGGFEIESVYFPNFFDTTYFYWLGGWALSNKVDSITSGSENLYASKPAGGFDNSSNYVIGQQNAKIYFPPGALPQSIKITNSTYAHNSMRDGDGFAKKFGGESGDDPDFFKLTIFSFENGGIGDSVEFYLADYRFEDNNEDYIVDTWEEIDISSLGGDSLQFHLSSTDFNDYGLNTPSFFCMDQVEIDFVQSTANQQLPISALNIFPNPAKTFIQIDLENTQEGQLQIFDAMGRLVNTRITNSTFTKIDLQYLEAGFYNLFWTDGNEIKMAKFVKQ